MSIPVWNSVVTFNKLDGSYVNDMLDCSGSIVCRGANSLWLDTNTSLKLNNAGVVTTISNTELSYLNSCSSQIQGQINASNANIVLLQTKTANQSAVGTVTTYINSHIFDSAMSLSNGRIFNINGNGNLVFNGTSFISMVATAYFLVNGIQISPVELSMLENCSSNIQNQLDSKGTDITDLQTKTANQSAVTTTTTYTGTHSFNSTVNLATSRTLNINGTAKIQFNGTTSYLDMGTSLGFLTNSVYISPQEISFLDNCSSNIQNQINSANTNIGTNTSNITTNTSNISTILSVLQGVSYNSGTDTTEIDNILQVNGYISSIGGLLGGSSIALTSGVGTSNLIMTSLATAGIYSTQQQSGDACLITTANPIIFVSASSPTQGNCIRLTNTQFQIYCNILANSTVITPVQLSYVSGLTSSAQTQLTALANKTANITNATGGATTVFSNTTNFGGTTQMLSGTQLNINGTANLRLNSANSYIDLGSSLGFLTNTVYISPLEMSYLDGLSSNIQTAINSINTSITDLVLKTTDITYTAIPATTTIANAVSCTGSLKVAQQAWLDGAVKLKTTYTAPASGELGFTVLSSLTTVSTITTNVVKNLLSVSLGIGVWIITYNCFIVYASPVSTSFLKLGLNSTSGSTQATTGITTESSASYVASKNYPMTQIVNVSSATTYYLTLYALFSGGGITVDGGNVNTSTLHAIRIA